VVRERLRSLLLPPDCRDHPVTLPGGNAVVAACFREPMINGDPPVALAILDQTAASAMVIGHFQVSEIFKAHACAAQDQHCVPVHRLEDVWRHTSFERASGRLEQSIKRFEDIRRKWPRLRHWGDGHIF